MKNEVYILLKKAGIRMNKRRWSTVTPSQLASLGITREMFTAATGQATIHMTMGPLWRYGIMLEVGKGNKRPHYFKGE